MGLIQAVPASLEALPLLLYQLLENISCYILACVKNFTIFYLTLVQECPTTAPIPLLLQSIGRASV